VKAGGMRVSKKQENVPVGKNLKPPGRDKTSGKVVFYYNIFPPTLMLQGSHKIPAAALQVAHQKPQPALEKFMLPK
ncbi:DAL1A protein, partial [Alectura lathami]|nr:DAL1A protein [Alectura lathami]